ncbi:hypothetical protein F652_611 [Enterobacteriaceae bacterium bta3-1]|nr:hypothetical protein F652_611 [Enterobacteriaceae bacterium bta3-1]
MLSQISMKYNFNYLMFYIELKYEKSIWAKINQYSYKLIIERRAISGFESLFIRFCFA